MEIMLRNPGRTRRGGSVGSDTFADIPGFVEARWQGSRLRVQFDRDLTEAEQQVVRDRCESMTASEEQLRTDARGYLTIKNPNAKDTAAQVARLTRLLLEDYDGSQA